MDAHDQKTQQQESRAIPGSKSRSGTARIEIHQSELLKKKLITADNAL